MKLGLCRRGFSLLETLIGVFLLSVAMTAAFYVFNLGTYYFKVGLNRQGLQAEGRRAMGWLEKDLRQSCSDGVQWSTNLQTSVPPLGMQERDALCLPGMDDWTKASNFDYNGNPLYNRYVIYYTTQSSLNAQMYRLEVAPGGFCGQKWTFFPGSAFLGPTLGAGLDPGPPTSLPPSFPVVARVMASHVLSFNVSTQVVGATSMMVCTLNLRGTVASQGGSGSSRDETLQFNLTAPIYNKAP